MTSFAKTNTLLHGNFSNGPSGTEKKSSTHTRGDGFLLPTPMAIHVLAYTHADRLRQENSAVYSCFRPQLSSVPPSSLCSEHDRAFHSTCASVPDLVEVSERCAYCWCNRLVACTCIFFSGLRMPKS
ncbi:hypothetical protein M3J09_008474 [Ascochyta lentis]